MFGKNSAEKDGIAVYCRQCAAAIQREWKKMHPEKVKAWRRRYQEERA
jgi:hypothetical protein